MKLRERLKERLKRLDEDRLDELALDIVPLLAGVLVGYGLWGITELILGIRK